MLDIVKQMGVLMAESLVCPFSVMAHAIDLTGKKFNRLKVVSLKGTNTTKKKREWNCVCDCGNKSIVITSSLINGVIKSCGCLMIETNTKHSTKHGKCYSSEYSSWLAMKQRCTYKKHESYYLYGGRGITVCKRWIHSFKNFYSDMGDKPSKDHSIERTNRNLGYSPSNCRWATKAEQMRNTRRTRLINFNGDIVVMKDLAARFGIPDETLRLYLLQMTPEKAVEKYLKRKGDST